MCRRACLKLLFQWTFSVCHLEASTLASFLEAQLKQCSAVWSTMSQLGGLLMWSTFELTALKNKLDFLKCTGNLPLEVWYICVRQIEIQGFGCCLVCLCSMFFFTYFIIIFFQLLQLTARIQGWFVNLASHLHPQKKQMETNLYILNSKWLGEKLSGRQHCFHYFQYWGEC